MNQTRRLLLPTALLIGLSFSANSQAAPTASDVEFMRKAAIAGQFEIQTSEVAKTRGTQPQIKSFADMMLTDHRRMAAELRALAKTKGVKLPAQLDAEHNGKLRKLQGAVNGKEFDEAYADLMEDSHDEAVDLFQTAADGADDPEVRALAAKALPTLKSHSEHAEKLDAADIAP